MWLIMNFKGRWKLKMPNNGYMFIILPDYRFIWGKLQDIPLLHGSLPMKANGVMHWVDWRLRHGTCLLQSHYK